MVKPIICGQVPPGLGKRPVFVKINSLVLDRALQPFDEEVVVHPARDKIFLFVRC